MGRRDQRELERSAAAANLRYVTDDEPGYTRKPWGRGFTYLDAQGEHVRDEALRERFASLAIPPAWQQVWICADPDGHLQVTGRDEAGRKQYIYHPRWEARRNLDKFDGLADFARALPTIRARCDADMRKRELCRERVLALAVTLLEKSFVRIGNARYAREHGSYGLTTLEDEHVRASTCTIHFEFPGKHGKVQQVDISDRRLARQIQRCQELPGQRLFTYCDETGCGHPIESGDVNAYLQEITGEAFSAKDFRTWGGTFTAALQLMEREPPDDEKEAEASVREAIAHTAETLGNTKAICRDYYIHPGVLDAFREGSFFEVLGELDQLDDDPHVGALQREERFVLALIEQSRDGSGRDAA